MSWGPQGLIFTNVLYIIRCSVMKVFQLFWGHFKSNEAEIVSLKNYVYMSILHLSYFMLDLNSSDLQITILMFAMFGTRHIPQFFSPSSILSHFKIKHNQLYTNVLGIFVKNKSLVVDRDTQHPPLFHPPSPPPPPPAWQSRVEDGSGRCGGRWLWRKSKVLEDNIYKCRTGRRVL